MEKEFAIVTNGGGMNCSYSAGALCSLAKNHNLKEPEFLIGSSGSTGSLAYYLAQQYDGIKNIWTNLLASKNFVTFKRLNRIMDIDYLIDEVFKKKEPLDVKKINDSKTKLFISATEYKSGAVKFFTNQSDDNIFESLRASKAIPMAFNKKVNINGIDYIDGSISAPTLINIEKAITEGARNILVIRDGDDVSLITKICWSLYSFFVNKKLGMSIKKYLSQNEKDFTKFDNINIFFISPSRKLKTAPLDNKREHLEDSFHLGFEDIRKNSKLKLFLDSIRK